MGMKKLLVEGKKLMKRRQDEGLREGGTEGLRDGETERWGGKGSRDDRKKNIIFMQKSDENTFA